MSTGFENVESLTQIYTFLLSIALGAAVGVVYDMFRAFRRAIPCRKISVFFQDVIFWLIACIVFFCFSLIRCEGQIRFFALLGMFSGFTLWIMTLGKYAHKLPAKAIHKLYRLAKSAARFIRKALNKLTVNKVADKIKSKKKEKTESKSKTKRKAKSEHRPLEKDKEKRPNRNIKYGRNPKTQAICDPSCKNRKRQSSHNKRRGAALLKN